MVSCYIFLALSPESVLSLFLLLYLMDVDCKGDIWLGATQYLELISDNVVADPKQSTNQIITLVHDSKCDPAIN